MKKILLALTLLAGLTTTALAQELTKQVLWIGNSYTDANSLPLLTQKVAKSVGDRIEYTTSTVGGCTFQGHCQNNSMTLIQQGGWDVVILQGQSQEPSFPQSQVASETFPYAQQLVEAVYQYNDSTVEPMFYMTWGRKNGDSYNAQFYPPLGTYEGMDSLLYERYMYMGRTFDASVCPVGRVWHMLRHEHSDIKLYANDGSHPSLLGSYAAACAFYVMLFHKDPTLIEYEADLDRTYARTIREVVKTVVFDSLTYWQRQQDTVPGPPIGIAVAEQPTEQLTGPFVLYNIMGQPVYQGTEAEQLDLRHLTLPKGIYILRSTRKAQARKIIKH